tara:strand:- start:1779 stop:2048 length:270 start_codon:yes stop_codon:yes gene_type:complete
MPINNYEMILQQTAHDLDRMKRELFTNLINLAMSGELQNINSVFDEGDLFQFELDHFKDIKDINIKTLINLLEQMEETIVKLEHARNRM